ncbi:RHS repeat-associated core domain-containing protein [Kitasatospora sp. NPDC091276]|uniref:RHS repeat-associated core domain-containing protein n=1 Tax=Kitasatospora sp. NPDC091276 TaxID=3155300 RepID=UPI0034397024
MTGQFGVTAAIGGGAVLIQAADPHGTSSLQVNTNATQTVTRRPTDPFGNPRGAQPTANQWAGTKGFVGGTKDDTTELTNLGARQYDPIRGRFISPDPILDTADPQQWNGYAYSNNNPVNLSDPSGLRPDGMVGGTSSLLPDGTTETWKPDDHGGWEWARTVYYGAPGRGGALKVEQKINFNAKKPQPANSTPQWIEFVPNATWATIVKTAADLTGVTHAKTCIEGSGMPQAVGCLNTMANLVGWSKSKALERGLEKGLEYALECNSFPAGTLVLLVDGTTKPIEKVTASIASPDDQEFTDLTLTTTQQPGTISERNQTTSDPQGSQVSLYSY